MYTLEVQVKSTIMSNVEINFAVQIHISSLRKQIKLNVFEIFKRRFIFLIQFCNVSQAFQKDKNRLRGLKRRKL